MAKQVILATKRGEISSKLVYVQGVQGSYLQRRQILFGFHGMGRILRSKDGGSLDTRKDLESEKHKTCLVQVNGAVTLRTWQIVDPQ